MRNLEDYFERFRKNIIGILQTFMTPYGEKRIVYADWTASGRLYRPIEEKISNTIGPFVGNTHSESSITGTSMTKAYHQAHQIIKEHVNAGPEDIIITAESGMTGVVNKFQRLLGLKIPDQLKSFVQLPEELKPIVFVTHMEHHSNHTSWIETIVDVECIHPDSQGLVDLNNLDELLKKYRNRKLKIGAFTSCSNVTGIQTPYYKMAKLMHRYDGYCFVDFAASAPYVQIDMHPEDPDEKLDAIYFSPHKFLGGPGTSGVLIFDTQLYKNQVPDHPGGGTVDWTNPWGQHKFISNIEAREDGGTPGFLQTIKAALCINLKNEMGVENLLKREEEIVKIIFNELSLVPGVHILADNIVERLGIISFYVENIHYNLIVKIFNDRFGIQVRGGCSCAGTYGHYLLHVSPRQSKHITDKIDHGDYSEKPGWVRFSIHPTMKDEEIYYSMEAIKEIVKNIDKWGADYDYLSSKNEYQFINGNNEEFNDVRKWFHF